MKLKKVLIPLVVTLICCMYFACFAIIYAAGKVSYTGKILGIAIPGVIVVIAIALFVKNYANLRKEAAEFDARLAQQKKVQEAEKSEGTEKIESE